MSVPFGCLLAAAAKDISDELGMSGPQMRPASGLEGSA